MRRPSFVQAALSLALLGCRVPAIPPHPTPREYALYNAWLEHDASNLPQNLAIAIDSQTLTPHQNEMQFQQCLPRRMQGHLESAPPVDLTSTSANEWLKLDDGREAHLVPHTTMPFFDHPTETIRLSRVAFTLSGYDAYLWVEQRRCGDDAQSCAIGSGKLIHGTKSSGIWAFEDTVCQALLPPT